MTTMTLSANPRSISANSCQRVLVYKGPDRILYRTL
jgi:hypothetical protein